MVESTFEGLMQAPTRRWQGPEEGQSMTGFIADTAEKIKGFWNEEYQRLHGEMLDEVAYRKVCEKTGFFSKPVITACQQLIENGNPQQKDDAYTLNVHHYLNSVISGIDRFKAKHPGVNFDATEAIASGVAYIIPTYLSVQKDARGHVPTNINSRTIWTLDTIQTSKNNEVPSGLSLDMARTVPTEAQVTPPPTDVVENKEIEQITQEVMGRILTPREAHTLFSSAIDDKTLDQIGEDIGGLSKERVRQIKAKATRKLIQFGIKDVKSGLRVLGNQP